MKRFLTLIFVANSLSLLQSCVNRRDNCIEYYIEEEGYSFDEAAEMCDDAQIEPRGNME